MWLVLKCVIKVHECGWFLSALLRFMSVVGLSAALKVHKCGWFVKIHKCGYKDSQVCLVQVMKVRECDYDGSLSMVGS